MTRFELRKLIYGRETFEWGREMYRIDCPHFNNYRLQKKESRQDNPTKSWWEISKSNNGIEVTLSLFLRVLFRD